MTEPSKKNQRPDTRRLIDIVKSNVASNEQHFRITIQNTAYKPDGRIFNHNGKDRSAPKPLLDCLGPAPLLTSKPYEKPMSQRRRKNKPFNQENLERSNDDQVNKPDISPGKTEIGRSTIDIREPTSEHLLALKNTFDKILSERSLSDNSIKQRDVIFTKLRQIIIEAHADAQVSLYGSVVFECCLEKPGIMDIDVQLKERLQYDTLMELLEIIKKSDLYKEAVIDTDYKPSCINLITGEPNMRVKITSGYTRGINLSKLIQIYTKFDPRVVKLLRLFRILAKICNIDKPEIGTLHPVVFHIMVIHFLQQLNSPVLPCLHEYAYGIDHVPLTMNENQYPEFFRVCEKYSRQWKSTNTTSVEMLFLQLLSYYVKTFNSKQFVVSIQTRMPVMKIDKNWHSRKLLIEDPTDIKRSLCQTMQSPRSINYFRDTLNAALNYFGRKQKKTKKIIISSTRTIENNDDDLVEVINEDEENELPTTEKSNLLHNSYQLFYKKFPPAVARDMNIKQARVRDYYRHTFDNKKNILPKGIIQVNSSKTQFEDLDENEIQEALQHDLENDFERTDENDDDQNENHTHLLEESESNDDEEEEEHFENEQKEIPTVESFSEQQSSENEIPTQEQNVTIPSSSTEETSVNDTQTPIEPNQLETGSSSPSIDDKTNVTTPDNNVDNQIPSPIEPNQSETGSPSPSVDDKTNATTTDNNVDNQIPPPIESEQILNEKASSATEKDTQNEIPSDFFYDFKPEHFHAEQGAPFVCTTCNGIGHLKTECPELIVPKMIDLPAIDAKWLDILTKICQQITERSKPKSNDIESRKEILSQLERQFQKDCPGCNLHAFGSFYNGFGFQKSDLDVCLVFKDEREQTNEEVVKILKKILRAMKSSNTFDDVQPILHAKVPIIRSRHRQLNIEIDISLHNMLAIENTRLLKTYTEIDPRVSELGYMVKHLAKFCGIGDASRGTLSSYAYIIMLIHFLQQIQPPVLPVLQELGDDSTKNGKYKKCSKWNVYFYDNVDKIKDMRKNENTLTTGALWIEFLRYYTEQCNYEEHVVTIRQQKPLLKHEKGWFRQTIAIEDPFELSHNLAGGLSPRNWALIRRVFIRAREVFGIPNKDINMTKPDLQMIEDQLFDIYDLCPTHAPKLCEWCRGPYHIRKRCPKFATLSNEKRRNRRMMNRPDQQWNMDAYYQQMPNYYTEDQNLYPQNYQNGRTYPKSAPTTHQAFRYPNPVNTREFHNANFHPNENNPQRANSAKQCFKCGQYGHVKVQCPSKTKATPVAQPKSSS